MAGGRSDVVGTGLERIESEQVINAQETRNALAKQFIRKAKIGDTTPSVLNVERLEFRNSSALLVTAFDDGQEGQKIEVLGDGNTTVENNAKIVTAGGADLLLDEGAVYGFTRYSDGKWHQSAGGSAGTGGAGVASFAGRTGAVVPVAGDYSAADVGAVPASHLTDPDPHTQYELDANKGAASGYAPLDGTAKVPVINLPAGYGSVANGICQVRKSTATNPTTSGVVSAISFDTEDSDATGMHDLVTNPSRVTILTSGRYFIAGAVANSVATSGVVELIIRKNGVTVLRGNAQTPGGNGLDLSVAGSFPLVAGDYIELCYYASIATQFLATQYSQILEVVQLSDSTALTAAGVLPAWVSYHPDTPPAAPVLFGGVNYNLEFKSGYTGLGTAIGSPTLAASIVDRSLRISSNLTASNTFVAQEFPCPTTAFTMTVKFRRRFQLEAYSVAHIGIRANGSGAGRMTQMLQVHRNTGTWDETDGSVENWTDESTGGILSINDNTPLPTLPAWYYRLEYTGTNVNYYWSMDGEEDNFRLFVTQGVAAALNSGTPGRCFFGSRGLNTTVRSVVYVDWVRFK